MIKLGGVFACEVIIQVNLHLIRDSEGKMNALITFLCQAWPGGSNVTAVILT